MLPEFVVKRGGFAVVDAQLNDWNVGFRKHVFQHDPGAVIESPLRVALYGQFGSETGLNLLRQCHIPRGGIGDLVHFLRETIKVIVHSRTAAGGNESAATSEPMRRD